MSPLLSKTNLAMSNTIPARSGPVAVRIKWESAGVEARETVIMPARARVTPADRKVEGCTAAVKSVGGCGSVAEGMGEEMEQADCKFS